MNRLSRILVLVSLLVAMWLGTRLGARELGPLLLSCEVPFALAFFAALFIPRATLAAALSVAYLTPLLLTIIVGRFRSPYVLIWVSLMLGGITGSNPIGGWAIPPRWRWPLATWALVIATTWPIVVWRETDFDFSLLANYRLANTSRGVAPPVATIGILDSVVTQLLGLLWFDWLYASMRRESLAPFTRYVALPLAIGAAAGCVFSIYQGFVDVSFLSGGQWPSLRRAAGPMIDANASGMIAACWVPAFVALALQRQGRGRMVLACAGLALGFAGLWASGSRTALMAGTIGIVAVLAAIFRGLQPALRKRMLLGVGGAAAAGVLILMLLPLQTIGPIQRVRQGIAGAGTFGGVVRGLWARDGYGTASTLAIRESPLVGVGVGSFTLLSLDYAWLSAALHVPYDNAQNWFRHQLAELGAVGSIGWVAWVALFAATLMRTRGDGPAYVPSAAIKGGLLGLTAASMLGVPTMATAMTLTFWTFAFWYLGLAAPPGHEEVPVPRALGRPFAAWTLLWAVVLLHAGGTLYAAQHQLSVPHRVKRIGWPYQHGYYEVEKGPQGAFRWTRQESAVVVPVTGRTLSLEFWTDDPAVATDPLDVKIWVDDELVTTAALRDASHLTRRVPVGPGTERVTVRTWVSRTWRPDPRGTGDTRELGLAVADWKFEP
jgi:hypothetical protein